MYYPIRKEYMNQQKEVNFINLNKIKFKTYLVNKEIKNEKDDKPKKE